ncbi:MAG: DUF1684 domain-containing protein [Acidobacteriota bacterium]
MMRRQLIVTLLAGLASGPTASASGPGSGYVAEILEWRQEREARLKADGGWLTVAGLFWLEEGENPFGTGADNAIVLPEGTAPARAGVFTFHDGRTTVTVAEGVAATVGGRRVTTEALRPDSEGEPDVLVLGDLSMHVIERGGRHGIRLKDRNSRFRREFSGLRWYPVDESYRVTARFVPYDPPRTIRVPTVLGTTEEMTSPGYAVFTIGDRELRLDPVLPDPEAETLFIIFSDLTTGEQTYPAGRFLYAGPPEEGRLVLDFNKAYNPPCAFTPYATCPLPPEQNRLPVRVEAGELDYGRHRAGRGARPASAPPGP